MNKLEQRQREVLRQVHGEPVISITFDGYSDGNVSMWAHTKHDQSYDKAYDLVLQFHADLTRFISDSGMCPFSPDFKAPD